MFNKYAAGRKLYGGGRDAPNIGPVDKLGYKERDAENRLRRTAILRRMQASQQGKFMSPNYQRRG